MRPVRLLLAVALVCAPRAASAQAGMPLGPEYRINTYTAGGQLAPAVITDAGSDVMVVWESPQDGSGTGIFGQRYSGAGAPLGSEFRVNTFTTGNQSAPAVASDITGNFLVVWASELQDGSGLGVFGQRYSSLGAPAGPEFRVNSYVTGDQSAPAASTDKSGMVFVVWQSDGQDGSGPGVFGQRVAPSGFPVGPEFRVNTATAAGQRAPAVAATQSGNFVIVWESDSQDGSGSGVFGQRYSSAGFPQGPEFRANSFTTGAQVAPAIAATFSRFVVVWQSDGQDGSGTGIFAQRFDNLGGLQGPEFAVNSFVAGDQSAPSVANSINGDFAVVWESANQDGQADGIFGQRFTSSGTSHGQEFRVNSYTTADQQRPSVAAGFSGSFVVVWMSDTQDGSGQGVFGQRYGPIVPVELTGFRVE